MTERYVALLRGVNVGGNNIIAMKSLASLFSDARCQNVETYIQSGNVVFSADAKTAVKLGSVICNQIHKQFGFQTTVVLRSLADMQRIVTANPYPDVDKSHVLFLEKEPTQEQVALLDPKRSAPDEFTVSGSEIYLYLPNGAGKTKLTNGYFDSKLKTVGTARNWRTALKLLAMMTG